jgi:pimeloyl-ACP methyl ester carboxylesterase
VSIRLLARVGVWLAVGLATLLGGLAVYTRVEVRRAEAGFPPRGAFVSAGGVRLHYVDAGSGAPVVLLHGNPGSVQDFSPGVADSLARSYRVLVFERLGHGYSQRRSARDDTPTAQARLLHAALDRLGVERPILVGHSWGGGLALVYTLEYPRDVAGLVLLGPRGVAQGGSDPVYRLIRTPVVGSVLRHTVLLPVGRRLFERRLAAAYAPDTVRREHWAAARALWLRPGQVAATVWDSRNLDRELSSARRRFGEIAAPVSIVTGERDELLAESRAVHQGIAGSELVILPNVGHEVQFSRPHAVVDAVGRVRRDGRR